jgi:large subunit ribosomal protein L24
MAARIRKGDTVAVVSGDDRGKRGRVLRVIPESSKVVVEGVNLVYKHLRKSQKSPQGGRVRREAPIHACKVMPVDPETNRPTRVRFEVQGEGRKVRLGSRTGATLGVGAQKAGAQKKGDEKSRKGAAARASAGAEEKE